MSNSLPNINFSEPFGKIIRSVQPFTKAPTEGDIKLMQAGEDPVGITFIPPNNCHAIIPKGMPKFTPDLETMRAITLPTNFNWCDGGVSGDDALTLAKKKLITQAGNQGACGSCWAFSSSTVISDRFVVSGQVNANPMISPTNVLSCYFFDTPGDINGITAGPCEGCDGGDPYRLALEGVSKGFVTSNCIDYASFCNQQNGCLKPPAGDLNEDIQKFCGCVNPKVGHDLFFITNPKSSSTPNQEAIKNEIFLNGPVVAFFHVFANFMGGKYGGPNDPTEGVYLENYFYDSDGKPSFGGDAGQKPTSGENWKGMHAVSIVGWGQTPKNKINYWVVRNSWGPNWGNNGTFKMAWYGNDPKTTNQFAQFDQSVTITVQGQQAQSGGIVIFDAGKIEQNQTFPQIGVAVPNETDPKFSQSFPIKPLQPGPGPTPSPKPTVGPTPSPKPTVGPTPSPKPTCPACKECPSPTCPSCKTKKWYQNIFLWIAVGIFIISIVILIYFLMKQRKYTYCPKIKTTNSGITIKTAPSIQNKKQSFGFNRLMMHALDY